MRWRCKITGIVQGVGFRPAIYRYATELGLMGFVRNDADGVTIEVEGEEESLKTFLDRLGSNPPPLARIDTIAIEHIEVRKDKCFVIFQSHQSDDKTIAVSPDISICDACVSEMADPSNRRYRYPFINCTDCGPRYTITKTVPYDRSNTSMAKFDMCEACRKEYENPLDRRYHAQPIACRSCGPSLSLWLRSEKLKVRSEKFRLASRGDASDLIGQCAEFLKEGKIVAIKGLGGFHLMCDATNDDAVRRLRDRKRRPTKPFALMVKDLDMAKFLARMNPLEEKLLTSKERPIVLMKKRGKAPSETLHSSLFTFHLSHAVAPGIDRLGLMLPYTPLHYLFFDHLDIPLVATSANLSDEPIIRDGHELMEKLGHVVDAVLDHDREILNACDDSVVQVIGNWPQWLRVARGLAPLTLPLPFNTDRKILAVGANQKNTIALAFDDKIVLSPHIGDLTGIEPMDYFERTVETFRRFYNFTPEVMAYDMHPGYETTKWAKKNSTLNTQYSTLSVQHHFAHALAAMAEHGVTDRVLAFTWDGTGYGDDGTIWGGEVLLADVEGFERIGHLRPFRLLGGEKAVREPRRAALALLFELYSLEEVLEMENPTVKAFGEGEIRLLHQAWQKGINAPVTTSMGRLFDAVASLAGVCQKVGYEGEAGLLLEAVASNNSEKLRMKNEEWKNASCGDAFILKNERSTTVLDWEPLVRRLAMGKGEETTFDFVPALVEVIVSIAKKYSKLSIVLAGGVFQNRTLCEAVLPKLKGRRVLLPRRTPVNDGAVALGQVWHALHRNV